MKSISNSDFSLLVEKLPIVLALARKAVPTDDTRAYNAIRRLTITTAKWRKQEVKLKNQKDND